MYFCDRIEAEAEFHFTKKKEKKEKKKSKQIYLMTRTHHSEKRSIKVENVELGSSSCRLCSVLSSIQQPAQETGGG